MIPNAPGVVHVITFGFERIGKPHVLVEPIDAMQIVSLPAGSAIVVSAILQEDSDWFLFALPNDVRIRMPTSVSQVDKASHKAEDFSEMIRPMPRDRERRDPAGT